MGFCSRTFPPSELDAKGMRKATKKRGRNRCMLKHSMGKNDERTKEDTSIKMRVIDHCRGDILVTKRQDL